MKHLFLRSLGMLALTVAISSCAVHQWPEPNTEPDPDVPDVPNVPDKPDKPDIPDDDMVALKLRLVYATEMTEWNHTYDPKMGKVSEVGMGDTYDNLIPGSLMEVRVMVHENISGTPFVSEQSFVKEVTDSYDDSLSINLPAGHDYIVTAWGHLLDGDGAFTYYDHTDFNSIKIIDDNYIGNTDYRDGFRGRLNVSIADTNAVSGIVPMKRPMAKFEFVTTDLSEFLTRETERRALSSRASATDYTVVISYPAYYPNAYTAMDDRLENAGTGYSFATSMTVTGESEASLGFDYVMINNVSDGAVQVQVTVFDNDGAQVASSGMLTVPLQRDRHTILRGVFLTTSGNGGIGIDPGFDGDHNITV